MSDQPLSPPLSDIPAGMAEAIAGYALEALPSDDEATVAAYLTAHPEARALCTEYQSIVGMLPYAATPSELPPFLREGVLRSIRDGRARHRRVPLPPVRYRFISAFAACALLFLLIWNIGLQVRTDHAPARPDTAISDILSQPGLVTYAMEPQTDAPNASGRIYLTPSIEQAAMSVWRLPQLPSDRTYQLWFRLDDQTRVSITTFTVDAKGAAVVRLNVPRMDHAYVQCGITLEPRSGSPQPTGPRMLTSLEWPAPATYP